MRFHRLNALLLALLPAAIRAEVPIDRVQWEPSYGTPTWTGLAGRIRLVLIWRSDNPAADSAHNRFLWYMNSSDKDRLDLAPLWITVGGATGSKPDEEQARVPHGTDDGSLLQAFAGAEPGVLLVIAPDGRVTAMKHVGEIDDTYLHTWDAADPKSTAQPLIDDLGQFPASVKKAVQWYLACDTKRLLATAQKVPAGDKLTATFLDAVAKRCTADATVVRDPQADSAARLMAELELSRLANDFPSKPAAEAIKALKAVKDDAAIKLENDGWAAFEDYLAQMKHERGKRALDLQKTLLPALIARHKGSYAADLAGRIMAFAKLGP
jgi:hypothetical protein